MTDTADQWEAFLNPDIIRPKLISAGLFLVGHEMLLDTIKRHPLSFFSDGWNIDGPVPGPKYKKEVLARDPQGKNDAKRGSIAWLRIMDVITADDEADIKKVDHARNEVAHEMTAIVSGSMPPSFAEHFETLLSLVQKIEKWWIVNVELSTDPEFNGEFDEDGIVSGPSWIMQILGQVALGQGEEARTLYREFVHQRKEMKKGASSRTYLMATTTTGHY